MRNLKILTFLCCSLLAMAAMLTAQEMLNAVKTGDLSKVRSLVENDPGIVNARDAGGQTVLFAAVSFGRLDIAEYLISKGANVDEKSNFHITPLDVACMRNAPLEIIRLLVEKGADVNYVAKYLGRPLDLALDTENEALIDYLKSKGAVSTPLEFETQRVAENVHRIAYPWGMRNNIVAFSGPDGILLIDTGFSKHAVSALRETIGGLAGGEIRIILSTHAHSDHVDGNRVAPEGARVIASKNLESSELKALISRVDRPVRSGNGQNLAAPYLMRFNRQEVQIIPHPGLHSPNDLLIYFPKSGILCMGDLLLSESCPAVQDVARYMAFLDKVLEIFPAGTTFVSGHGRDLTGEGLRAYRDDLAGMIAVVRKNHDAGKSPEDMVREDVLRTYKARYSLLDWLGPDAWLVRVVEALRSGSLK